MSDLLLDMHLGCTAATLTNSMQQKIKCKNEKNVYGADIYSNNKQSFISSSTPQGPTRTNFDANIDDDVDDDDDEFGNVLSLQLRKPKHWRWELSTSRSCANIALPRILLYDYKGNLLVDANSQVEQCYSEPQRETGERRKSTPIASDSQTRNRKRANKALTTSLAHSIKKALDRQFSGLQIQEATPSPVPSHNRNAATSTPTTEPEQASTPTSAIDFYTNELPDCTKQRRANSLKGVRFKVNDNRAVVNTEMAAANKSNHNFFNLADLPTPPSTITTTTTTPTNSSSSGPREKRRYRRSHSSGRSDRSPGTSESILERFSFNKGRFSSPEYGEEHEVYHAPRYFLRTSKAGTLVVQEESFSRYRRRRRLRNSSTENMQSGTGSGSKSSLKMSDSGAQRQLKAHTANGEPTGAQSYGSLLNVIERPAQVDRRKVWPVRRHRSDGSVLLQPQASSVSDGEQESERGERGEIKARRPEKTQRRASPRKYVNHKRQSRKELIIVDPENSVQPGAVALESR